MDVLFTLIPLSVALVFAVIAILCWAVFSGQFDDVEAEAGRILEDDEGPPLGNRS
jgi:cbb3-type cytochrome oxidase maturation protein